MNDFRPDIWLLQANIDTQGLIDALKNDDPSIRKRSAAALRALGATEAIPHIKAALENESDPETRSNLLSALAALDVKRGDTKPLVLQNPPDEAFEAQIQTLKGEDHQAIIETAEAVKQANDKRAVDALVVAFHNTELPVNVRLVLAETLLALDSAPVEVALLGALRSNNWKVRRNGAAILGQMKADWAVEPLAVALTDENEIVKRTALAALKFINTPEARQLISAGGKPSSNSPSQALETQESESTRVTRPSSKMMQDATEALSRMNGKLPDDHSTPDSSDTDDRGENPAVPVPKFVNWPRRNNPELPDTKPLDPNKGHVRRTGKLRPPVDEDTKD